MRQTELNNNHKARKRIDLRYCEHFSRSSGDIHPKSAARSKNFCLRGYRAPNRELCEMEKGNGVAYDFEYEASEETTSGIPRWKRVLDLTCILISSPLWWPVMVFLALWIKIVSPGPIFFFQKRVGYRGNRFMMCKFRSMKVNAETGTHENHFDHLVNANCPMTKLDAAGDSRIIRGGRILRALGLDELPQIFNVIRGEMSLVGPRPCTLQEFKNYDEYQRERFQVLPGMTGYWQVNGKNNTTFKQMVDLDIYYARHLSPRLDLETIIRTLPTLFIQAQESRRGSSNGG